jgi:EmrB/QacA subfamily drug resistance transporter
VRASWQATAGGVAIRGDGDREAAEEDRRGADPRPGSGADAEAGARACTEPTGSGAPAGLTEAAPAGARPAQGKAAAAGGVILLTLAAGQFLMTLDSSVMNVSIATVAKDVGTTVTGIQGAITAYTLVMACLMITGAKVGSLIGRKRAFAIGCVIYGCGSLTTALAPNLPVLLLGWSFLEGVGAALILPAIVALVASNFPAERRPAAYGLVAAAGAVAVAVGPLIGGFATTYFSWRWVFAGEVVLVLVILLLARRIADSPSSEKPKLDLVGAGLSALGLGLFVFGILKSGEWGWLQPRSGGPSWAGFSPVIWLILGGLFVLWVFFRWEDRVAARGREPLVRRAMFKNDQLKGGLTMFLFQYLVQAGIFFVVPLYLSVALGLSAIDTGVRILPLSITLLAAAIGVPRIFPTASPRLIVRSGLLALLAGTVVLMALLDVNSGPEVVLVPLLLIGLGIGALASQLGAVTVSAVPDEQSSEVGGVQNTMTNLGASIGTALAGAILISTLTTAFAANIEHSDAIPQRVKSQAQVQLASGVPFVSDADLNKALDEANVPPRQSDAALAAYKDARIAGLESALAILALASLIALFLAQKIPTVQPGAAEAAEATTAS